MAPVFADLGRDDEFSGDLVVRDGLGLLAVLLGHGVSESPGV